LKATQAASTLKLLAASESVRLPPSSPKLNPHVQVETAAVLRLVARPVPRLAACLAPQPVASR
jgi:hypothetical protein